MKLLDTPKSESVKIISYTGGKGVESKLRQLGICRGKVLKVIRFAPLGGPVMVDVDGRSIALGRKIAEKIQVEKV